LLLTGAGIIAIKHDTLKIESVKTPGGDELSLDEKGKSKCKPGIAAPVSNDGKSGLFSFGFTSEETAPRMPLTVAGSIVAKVSPKTETATHKSELEEDAEAVELGPFKVAVTAQRRTLRVQIEGPSELFANLEVESGGNKFASAGASVSSSSTSSVSNTQISFSSGSGTSKTTFTQNSTSSDFASFMSRPATKSAKDTQTHTFTLPAGAKDAIITITYWTEPRDKTIPFDVKVF